MKRWLLLLILLSGWWGLAMAGPTSKVTLPLPIPYSDLDSLPNSTLVYTYWFDQDYSTHTTDTLTNGANYVDVTSLSEGYHLLHLRLGTGRSSTARSYLFYRPIEQDTTATGQELVYTCWFDQDYSTHQTYNLANGINLIDVTTLSEGYHILHLRLGRGSSSSARSFLFYKPIEEDTTVSGQELVYTCWFDQNYSTHQTYSLANGINLIDVTTLNEGYHILHLRLGRGSSSSARSFLFYKPVEEDTTVSGQDLVYTCWFDQDFVHRQSGQIGNGLLSFDVSHLSHDYHYFNIRFGRGKNSSVRCYRFLKGEFHPIYLDTVVHGNLSVQSSGNIISGGDLIEDSSLVTIIATPSPGYTLQYLIVNNDTVISPFSFYVTDTVYVQAFFRLYAPELHVTALHNSDLIAGQTFNVSWTIQNDGNAPTAVGATWMDRLYLSASPTVTANSIDAELIGSYPNVSALDSGQSYTRTITASLPLRHGTGLHYLFLITDAQQARYIPWADSMAALSYTPPPYLRAYNGNYGDILEMSEVVNTSYHDNFNVNAVQISVPPLADLEVTNLVYPMNFFSGSQVSVNAVVTNTGQALTLSSGWRDVLYISHSDQFDNTALQLSSVWHNASDNAYLSPDSSYQVVFSGTVPLRWYGESYFYVVVDEDNNEYEHAANDNNTYRSNAVNVILTPPADLVVNAVTVPDTATNQTAFTINYTVSNVGLGNPDYNNWYDRVYLCDSAYVHGSGGMRLLLESNGHSGGLAPGSQYTMHRSYQIPSSIDVSQNLYILVTTDAGNQVFEYQSENNNSRTSGAISVQIFKPDFYITDVHLSDTIVAGYSVGVSFTLHNGGHKDYLGNLGYRIFYSSDSVYNPATATFISSSQSYTSVLANAEQRIVQSMVFPSSIPDGNYYLHVVVNPYQAVQEEDYENNVMGSGRFHVSHRPLPDLVLCNVSIPDTLQAGGVATISFDVVNNCQVTDYGAANIFTTQCLTAMRANTVWCPVQMQISPYPIGSIALAVGDTVHYVQQVLIPPTVEGAATIDIHIDTTHNIQEYNETNNSIALSRYVRPVPFDISVQNIIAPESYTTGDTLDLRWTVSINDMGTFYRKSLLNRMDVTGYRDWQPWDNDTSTLWIDRIYLSSDSVLSSNDIPLGSVNVSLPHAVNGYTAQLSKVMPHVLSGNLYLIVISDSVQSILEITRVNNKKVKAISATLAPQPNLRVSALLADDTVTQRQGCLVRYTVVNDGEGDITNASWVDKFYCGATLVATVPHNGNLLAGESYTDSVEVVIPADLIGAVAFRVYTDADNNVFENDHENDNSLARSMLIMPGPICDLVVTHVSVATIVTVGSTLNVSWTVQNIGEEAVSGYIKDGIYLSRDTILDNGDVLIGTRNYQAALAVYGSIQQTMDCTVQGVTTGDYYVLVRTNIMSAFNETSFTNNTQTTAATTEVSLPTLLIGQAEQLTLASGHNAYYRMAVGPEYAGQTLMLTLTTEATNAFNGIYLAHETMPSSARYDFGASVPYATEQLILVPVLQAGTYYLMASAATTNGSPQEITLLANIVDFEILRINTASGANTGSVTTQIIGAKFDTIMDFRLTDANGYTPAQKVKFTNTTESYVTFNLTDLSAGTYNVEAELPGGIVTFKENAFVVEQGLPAELVTHIISPSSVRVGNTAALNIEYGNNGQTDINVSGFLVISANGHPIASSVDGLSEGRDILTFSTAELGMDPDIIRPGHFATKTIFVNANASGTLSIYIYPIRRRYE